MKRTNETARCCTEINVQSLEEATVMIVSLLNGKGVVSESSTQFAVRTLLQSPIWLVHRICAEDGGLGVIV